MNQAFKEFVSGPGMLLKEAAEGNTEAVRNIVKMFPDKVRSADKLFFYMYRSVIRFGRIW